MLRWIVISGVVVFGLAALVAPWEFLFLLTRLGLWSPCDNDIVQEAVAPDGTRRALVFQRDCGATTAFSTQVAIVLGANDLPDQPANVFIADGHPDTTNTEVRWKSSATLVITTDALSDAYKAERHVKGVSVTYERR